MRLFIPGPAGRLEAILWSPKNSVTPRAAAVVCHPHPAYGGTMDNNIVFRVARGLQLAGLAVLRFNFRGVELSEGVHDGNGAEEADAVAALDHLEREFPGLPLWGAGFSFGARTLASLARRETRLRRVLLVAVPSKVFDCAFVRELAQPTHVLLAGNDKFGGPDDFQACTGALPDNIDVDVISGVDHFFRGQTPELERRVRAWAKRSLATP